MVSAWEASWAGDGWNSRCDVKRNTFCVACAQGTMVGEDAEGRTMAARSDSLWFVESRVKV